MVCNFFQIIKNTDLRSEKNGKEKKKGETRRGRKESRKGVREKREKHRVRSKGEERRGNARGVRERESLARCGDE